MTPSDPRWGFVFERDKGFCEYCNLDLLQDFTHYYFAEVDHLLPNGDPRREDTQYMALACRACNSRLSAAHRQGLFTVEARKAYLAQTEEHSLVKAMYDQRVSKLRATEPTDTYESE